MSVLKFDTEAAQIDLKEALISGAGFFFVISGQLVDGVQCGKHMVFTVKLVLTIFNQFVLGQSVDILTDRCGVFCGLVSFMVLSFLL